MQAANPDIVYVAAYPPDNVGIIRAANEIGLKPKMFGGAMIGMLITPIKVQLGPVANGLVISETFLPSPKLQFAGLDDLMKRYQAKAPELKTDPIGYAFVPFGYAAGQMLAKAVTETKSLDHDKLADYMRSHSFETVVGEIAFGKDGEWTKPRQFTTQFQNVAAEQPRSVPRRLEAADPVAARIQDRRHDLSLRRREEEAVDRRQLRERSRRRRAAALFCSGQCVSQIATGLPSLFARRNFVLTPALTFARVMFVNDRRSEREPIHRQKFFVKAIAQIAPSRLIRKRTRFAQSSCFVRKPRIGFKCGTDFERTNFRLTGKVVGPRSPEIHFAIAG